MYQVSNDFNNASLDRTREISVKAKFNGSTLVDSSNIVDLTFEELCVSGDNPSMGEACANKVVLKMYAPENPPVFKSGYMEPYVGLKLSGGSVEYCPLGKFFISEYTSDDDYKTVQITAYDKMAMLNSTCTYSIPTTCQQLINSIASRNGFTVEETEYPSGNLIDKAISCTDRQMIGYVAGLMGKNAKFNKDGKLQFFWYESEAIVYGDVNEDGVINSSDISYINSNLINKVTGTEYESYMGTATAGTSYLGGTYDPNALTVDVNRDHIVKADDVAEIQAYINGTPYNPTIVGTKEYPYKATQSNIVMGGFVRTSDETYTITGIESGYKGTKISSGTSDRIISFENPFITQSILDGIMSRLVFEYTPCTVQYQGNPAFEIGDMIGAVDSTGFTHNVPIMVQTFTIGGGMTATIEAKGTTEVQSVIEVSALEDILEPLEDSVSDLEDKVGDTSVAEQIEAMKEEIQANLGGEDGTFSILYNADGSQKGWKIQSTSDANKCWIFDAGGLRYSSNGGSTFSTVAIDYQGNMYATTATIAGTLTANAVLSNKVTAQNLDITGGSVSINTSDDTSSYLLFNSASYTTRLGVGLKIEDKTNTSKTSRYGMSIELTDGTNTTDITRSGVSTPYLTVSNNASISGNATIGGNATITGDLTGKRVFATGAGTSTSDVANARIVNTGQICYTKDGSLRKFKHDIKPIDDVLDCHKLYDVDVVSFKYNDDYIAEGDVRNGKDLAGFIVDDLLETCPDLVSYGDDGEPENWNPRYAIPMMLKLIQEQKQKIDELEERISVLEDGNL